MDITAESLEALGPMTGGHVLVIRGLNLDYDSQREMAEQIIGHFVENARSAGFANAGDAAGLYCPLLLFLEPGATIEHLDPDDMFEAGWVRRSDRPL